MFCVQVMQPKRWENSAVNAPSTLRVAMTLEQFWHRVPGGTAVAAHEMARALTSKDIDIVGVAGRHRRPADPQWALPIEIAQLPLPRVALYEAWHRLRRPPVEKATGSVDVVHATTMAIPPRTAPLVVTIHDLAWIDNPSHFSARGVSFFKRGFELARADADLLLCPSRSTLEACRDQGIDDRRLRLVPLGVGVKPATQADVERVRARYELVRPYIMWTGTIEPRKNLRGLIEAYSSMPADRDLVLVGPKGWNEDLDSLVAGRKERVKVLGYVPAGDLRALYAGADVFCFPSLLEGFGFPVLEAMAQGTPVVTSQGTSTEELARDAGVLVDPRDPESIAEGMQRVLDDAGYAETLAVAGRDRSAEYSWARTADLLIEAYREVAG